MSEAGFDQSGRVADEQEALWTRLFADWLEEQAELVLRELERDHEADRGAGDPATADAKRSTSRAI